MLTGWQGKPAPYRSTRGIWETSRFKASSEGQPVEQPPFCNLKPAVLQSDFRYFFIGHLNSKHDSALDFKTICKEGSLLTKPWNPSANTSGIWPNDLTKNRQKRSLADGCIHTSLEVGNPTHSQIPAHSSIQLSWSMGYPSLALMIVPSWSMGYSSLALLLWPHNSNYIQGTRFWGLSQAKIICQVEHNGSEGSTLPRKGIPDPKSLNPVWLPWWLIQVASGMNEISLRQAFRCPLYRHSLAWLCLCSPDQCKPFCISDVETCDGLLQSGMVHVDVITQHL